MIMRKLKPVAKPEPDDIPEYVRVWMAQQIDELERRHKNSLEHLEKHIKELEAEVARLK